MFGFRHILANSAHYAFDNIRTMPPATLSKVRQPHEKTAVSSYGKEETAESMRAYSVKRV